jgi:hypothetical protein
METIFNFAKQNTEFIYALHPKSEIILRISRINNSTAYLYFTNQLNEKIDIPSEFIIYHKREVLYPDVETNDYTLYLRKNYDIVYNGETLFNIRNEKTWTIYN